MMDVIEQLRYVQSVAEDPREEELYGTAVAEIEALQAENARLREEIERLKRQRLPEWVKAMKAETLREAQEDDGHTKPAA